jgi:hypothetical protein
MNTHRRCPRSTALSLTTSVLFAIGGVSIAVAATGSDQNEDSATLKKAGDSIVLTVLSGRPTFRATQKLQEEYGYVITYEDPPYRFAGDLHDIAPVIRKDYAKFPVDSRPIWLVPKTAELDVTFPVALTTSGPQGMHTILAKVVAAANNIGSGGRFRVEQDGDVFHVIPVDIRDRDGNWVGYEPLLDSTISFPLRDRTEADLYKDLAVEVGAEKSVQLTARVNSGIVFGHQGPDIHTNLSASNERARSVLTRAIQSHPGGKRTWVLLDMPELGDHIYTLNIQDLPRKSPEADALKAAQAAHPAPSDAAKRNDNPAAGPAESAAAALKRAQGN